MFLLRMTLQVGRQCQLVITVVTFSSTIAQLSLDQAPLYHSSTQPKPSPTLLLLSSAQTKPHSTIAQLSPNQAPLY